MQFFTFFILTAQLLTNWENVLTLKIRYMSQLYCHLLSFAESIFHEIAVEVYRVYQPNFPIYSSDFITVNDEI